jgi:hypothetical protein
VPLGSIDDDMSQNQAIARFPRQLGQLQVWLQGSRNANASRTIRPCMQM